MKNNVPCGGWCPEGRKAEDGIIPDMYPVQELKGGGYDARTRKNVQDSDGTVIISFGQLSGGTQRTLHDCLGENKPYLLLDGQVVNTGRAAEQIMEFHSTLPGGTLNVAGPRASDELQAYEYTLRVLKRFLALHGDIDF